MDRNEFFQNVLDYLEGRLQMVDSRANIFLFVALGLLAAYGYFIKEFFYGTAGYLFLATHIVVSLVICVFFLQTLRPTHRFLGLHMLLDRIDIKRYIFWPEYGKPSELVHDKLGFQKCLAEITDQDVFENYEAVIYVEWQLVHEKYRFYRIATELFKVLLIFDAFSLFLLVVTAIVR